MVLHALGIRALDGLSATLVLETLAGLRPTLGLEPLADLRPTLVLLDRLTFAGLDLLWFDLLWFEFTVGAGTGGAGTVAATVKAIVSSSRCMVDFFIGWPASVSNRAMVRHDRLVFALPRPVYSVMDV